MNLKEARKLRELEKDNYLEANLEFLPDAHNRWVMYENLICDKFLGEDRRAYGDIQRALDEAWVLREQFLERNRVNKWVNTKSNRWTPRSNHGLEAHSERARR